jgi:hypothetical protein
VASGEEQTFGVVWLDGLTDEDVEARVGPTKDIVGLRYPAASECPLDSEKTLFLVALASHV